MAELKIEYGLAHNEEFLNRIVAAMAHTCLATLSTIQPSDPLYYEKIEMCRTSFGAVNQDMLFVARVLVAAGKDNTTGDTELQTTIDNQFNKLALLFVYGDGGTG